METNWKGKTVFTGDNLYVMRGMNSGSVDLIYLDPPFNSNRAYAAPIGSEAAGAAFKDTWTLSDVDLVEHNRLKEESIGLYALMEASRHTHSKGMFSYLVMMAVRLLEMKRVLKDTGSIYLHCDATANSYLRLVMDAIFGHGNFQNEIAWRRYDRPKGSQYKSRRYGRSSDILLFYSMGNKHTFNADEIQNPLSQIEVEKRFPSVDDNGRFMSGPLVRSPSMGDRPNLVFEFQGYTPGSYGWRMGRDKLQEIYDKGDFYFTTNGVPRRKFRPEEVPGEAIDNIWIDIKALGSQDQERTGYPTQKPLKLLDRIVKASSNKGDVVLDPFCGCATTLVAAEDLQRNWVGIDISEKAVELVRSRIEGRQGLFRDITHRDDIPRRTDLGEELKGQARIDYKKVLYGLQEGYCNGCHEHFQIRHFHMDHITPRVRGGTDHAENFQLLCGNCNSRKGAKSQSEFKALLAKEKGISTEWI